VGMPLPGGRQRATRGSCQARCGLCTGSLRGSHVMRNAQESAFRPSRGGDRSWSGPERGGKHPSQWESSITFPKREVVSEEEYESHHERNSFQAEIAHSISGRASPQSPVFEEGPQRSSGLGRPSHPELSSRRGL
jgi:hypothetical protein